MSKMIYTDDYGTYTVEKPDSPVIIYDVITELVKPLLMAAGFSEDLVDEALGIGIDSREDD